MKYMRHIDDCVAYPVHDADERHISCPKRDVPKCQTHRERRAKQNLFRLCRHVGKRGLIHISYRHAVAASLFYLGLQAHQNAKHARALIQAGRVDRLMNQMIGFSDADKCAAYLAGNGLEPTQDAVKKRQFMMQCLAQVATMLDVFTQHSSGLLSDEQFKGVCGTYRVWLREPGFRQQWLDRSAVLGPEQPKFTVFVDGLLEDAPPRASKAE